MIWLILAIIGAGTFIFSGFSVLSDPFCQSVDFGGGRVIQISCRNDSFGAFSQVSAGWLSILGGLGILLFIFRKPIVNILKVPNYSKNQRGFGESSQQIDLGSQEMTSTLDSQPISQDTKKCKYCAELINVEAIKCKHCGSSLTPNSSEKIKSYLMSDQGKIVSVISACLLLILSAVFINQSNKAKEMALLNSSGQICVTGVGEPSVDFGCTDYPNGEIYFCTSAKVLNPFWAGKEAEEAFQGTNYNGRIRGIRPGEIGHNCPTASLPNLFAYKWVSDFRVGTYELLSIEYVELEDDSYISGSRAGDFNVEISIKK
jgi:hypothetical protein